jgi:beta-lactamase regulating signal transducer with metallopeptidase domain
MLIMLNNLYNQLFIMSIAVSVLYLVLRLLNTVTMKCFSAVWHYYTYTLVYMFLLLPYHKLIKIFHQIFGLKSGINSVFPRLSFSIRIPASDFNDLVSVDMETGMDILLNSLIFYLLVAGSAVFLLIVVIQNHMIYRRIFGMCSLADETQTLQVLSKCRQKMKVSQNVLIYTSPYATTPFLFGIFKPRIVLPEAEFTAGELKCIFCHELMHWKRHDAWLKCLMLLANAIHWYNPLAYMARNHIEHLCELSCDESIAYH